MQVILNHVYLLGTKYISMLSKSQNLFPIEVSLILNSKISKQVHFSPFLFLSFCSVPVYS